MPVTPTYPGVYIEEVPSGVRTITGVATSITAFIGRAVRGPVNEPITINSYADFERTFGGLWVDSTLGYAVRDFYQNGGSQAIIVRLTNGATLAGMTVDNLGLEAASAGAWGNQLRARVDHNVSEDMAESFGLDEDDLFNLTVRDVATGLTEEFRNVTVVDSPRQVDNVLANSSRLVRVTGALANTRPAASDATLETAAADADPAVSGPALALLRQDPFTLDQRSVGVADANIGDDGDALEEADFNGPGTAAGKTGLYALENADLFNLLVIPPYLVGGNVDAGLVGEAAAYCEARRAFYIVDAPVEWDDKDAARAGMATGVGTRSKNAAVYFPRLRKPNPLRDNQLQDFAPSGAVAGVMARTDSQRGIWKAPAGLDATLVGVPQLSVPLTDNENGELNPLGLNSIRIKPAAGPVVWGARTLRGDDRLASEWKYVPVRRLALFIEESLYRGTQWVVFEPNDEALWAQIRLNVGAFMQNLFRQGAFQGTSPREAYFVKCDKETTTQDDINRGIVNILVGFAPLKPAEFVIIRLQQMAGQIQA
ncbi:MAG: phage tail sheath family protein [Burkholderiales bacterium]|nr:phage tail sheath family protein [Anaerolineae bacterium]